MAKIFLRQFFPVYPRSKSATSRGGKQFASDDSAEVNKCFGALYFVLRGEHKHSASGQFKRTGQSVYVENGRASKHAGVYIRLVEPADIHEWIHEQMRLQEDEIQMIQADGPRRREFIKFVSYEKIMNILRSTKGQLEYTMWKMRYR
jgi:hypothetical protein